MISARNGRQRISNSSNCNFEIRQITSVVQTSGDLLFCEVRKFSDDLFLAVTSCKVTEHETRRNSRSFDPRFSPKHVRRTFNVFLPCDLHCQPQPLWLRCRLTHFKPFRSSLFPFHHLSNKEPGSAPTHPFSPPKHLTNQNVPTIAELGVHP